MKVFNALKQVLEFKDNTTVAELSKLTGLKQLNVIEILNRNNTLFKRDKKTGKIFGFHDVTSIQKAKAYEEGRTYRVSLINYGAASEITTKYNSPEVTKLKQNYCAGGFGDSYNMNVILYNDDNVLALERLGLINQEQFFTKPIERLWKE